MLKLIYTETAVHLELLTADLDDWIERRLIFATSTGETLLATAERANFLLPETICEATAVNFYLHNQGIKSVTVHRCDLDRVEIGLTGYWLCTNLDRAEGIFVTHLPDRVESYLWELWSSANQHSFASDSALG
ncbi:alr0857 family protein [Chamaesiphon sp.]|uniref:alr0857 family protein n=1 Tax=Chamaesiphon sp. TaxID=2814140 RepID=UPI0035940FBF